MDNYHLENYDIKFAIQQKIAKPHKNLDLVRVPLSASLLFDYMK